MRSDHLNAVAPYDGETEIPRRHQHVWRIILVALCVLATVGCAGPAVRPSAAQIANGDGMVVTHAYCSQWVNWLEFHASGSDPEHQKYARAAATVHCPVFGDARDALRSVRLKAGRYFVGRVGLKQELDYAENDAVSFEVAAGKTTYIGDLKVVSVPVDGQVGVDVVVVDGEAAARAEAERRFPEVLARWPWEKRLARAAEWR